jgi:hypothetical protein
MKHAFVHSLRATAVFALVALAACSDSSSPTSSNLSSPSTAASMSLLGGDGQTGTVGAQLNLAPEVELADAQGNPVVGVVVKFTVTAGGGSIQNTTATTNSKGVASAGTWTLGTTQGGNVLEATSGALSPVRFVATGVATTTATTIPTSGSYNIVIRWVATATARQQQAVAAAVSRWQSVITRDLPDVPLTSAAGACFEGQPAINERVDDIVIYVEFVPIDGAGQILGEAGPCYVRSDTNLPLLGHLKLDAADLAMMERSGTLDDVVLHEMGHILGIGTLWPDKNLIQGAGGTDPRFIGPNALNAYHGMGGVDASIAVENSGADGTRDGHWRESTFGNELMTGYIGGTPNPMSEMTIASLMDLGYGTNSGAASGYTLTNRTSGVVQGFEMHGHETLQRPKFKVDHEGRKTRLPTK